MTSKPIYFPNLNGLRFFAATLVIIHHIEQIKSIFKMPSYWNNNGWVSSVIHIIGPQGVVLFFVLSGFLITFLLLAEEEKTKTIKVRKFYIRRVLRIWPLYLLIVFLSLYVFVHIDFLKMPGFEKEVVSQNLLWKTVLYLLFFANLVLTFFGAVPYASQTWSIGTEEQFYLAWPVIIKFFKKNRLLLMVAIVILYKLFGYLITRGYFDFLPQQLTHIMLNFWYGFTIDCMAIGGFFAVLLFTKHPLLKWVINNYTFAGAIISVFTCWAIGLHIPNFNSIVYSGLYAIIIINFAANDKNPINLEYSAFNYLGNISYGLYMLHPIAITIAIKTSLLFGQPNNYIIYPMTIGLTIGLASLSYRYYENYFLKFKSKFAVVKSGNEK